MSTPRPSQKKQATLTSFFTPKSSGSLPPSSPVPASQPSQPRPSQSQQLPSRKRPLEKEVDQNKGIKGNKGRSSSAAKGAKGSNQKPNEKENDDDDGGVDSGRSRFERAVKRARTAIDDDDDDDDDDEVDKEEAEADDDFVLDEAPEEDVQEPEPEPELPLPDTTHPASSQPRSSGRTDRYVYDERAHAPTQMKEEQHSQRSSSDSDSDDPETKRRKQELHRKFVKKLGHPDSLVNMRRRNFDAAAPATADAEGGDAEAAEDDDDEEPQPKKGAGKKKGKLTPMELQFLAIKRKHLDTLLVVEVGYKFKFLGEDARAAARVLGIVCIPGKLRYDEHASEAHLDRFASASIPVPRLPVHVKRLVAAGHKVGVVRQMETAALKKAGDNRNAPFVRQLTNIYTKGTYIEEDELGTTSKDKEASAPPSSGYLLCLTESTAGGAGADEKVQVGMLAVQPATGDILYDSFEDGFMRNEVETRLLHIAPCELLLVGDSGTHDRDENHLSRATEKLVQHISGSATNVFGDRTRVERVARTKPSDAYTHVTAFYSGKLADNAATSELLDKVLSLPENVTVCLSAMITHLTEYGLQHIFDLTKYFSSFTTRQHMLLNGTTLESLEVYRNATDHGLRGSLLWSLDKTQTRFGHRLLRKWIGRPLLDRTALEARVEAVEELLKASGTQKRDKLEQLLSGGGGGGSGGGKTDLERSLIRIYYGKCTRSELVAVLQTLQRISSSYAGMPGTLAHPASSGFTSPLILNCIKAIPAIHKTVAAYLDKINAEAARTNDKYQFFREAHETDDITSYKVGIAAVEAELDEHRAEIAKTLGKAAKPNYITVAGIEYLVEVNNAGGDLKRVPASWIKISGTKRASRFHTPTVVRLISERDQHKESLAAACDSAFRDLLSEIGGHYQPLRDTVAALATLDCLLSLAKVAALPGYARPTLLESDPSKPGTIDIQGGRHPVAEHTLPSGYIPFSTTMGGEDGSLALLVTGPNMGGKSSFVRAVALLTLLAQIGSYVPADAMQLTLADAIYTRMGARDNLFAGESTFMVEVSETAAILRAATPRSLVVLDELGRGTSTHDGAAIAQAVLEHMARETRCLTLFITHYQSLGRAALSQSENKDRAPIQNVHMAFREDKDTEEITFLYEVAPGMAHRSYGLNVARLANIPQRVLDVAAGKSHEMEMDVRRRRLQAAVKLAADVLGPHTAAEMPRNRAGADQLEYLMSSIEQL
ncbi:dna mismatch repair protein msh3 [Ophiostoma piceae UAMH 11346]|uniref:DNA mismatch repair protein n=1 Tax=Ophiostoma piceae (strain UAMH 11346) TaxID=1262450 RepID=S3BUT7_OPHP1|nr:dna mismatch repair protein msh3 [Ophiostoma piceae UAMH 11346]